MSMFSLATSAEISHALGARVRRQRLAGGLRQRELAARAGVSETTLRNLEREGQGTLESFIKIVVALGMGDQLSPVLDVKATSLKAMEQASKVRQRAPRRSA